MNVINISALALAILLSGCVQHHQQQAAVSDKPVQNFAPPTLLADFSEKVNLTRQQAQAGQLNAQQQYGSWLASAGQNSAAQPLLRAAAEQHQAEAQFKLGLLLLNSDPTEAKHWLERAAEQGHSQAAQQLARYHRNGAAHLQDKLQAFNWLLHAAQLGDAQAQNDVGAAYSRGDGVKKNAVQAAEWYRKAAIQGHALAQFNLAGAYQAGEGVKVQPLSAYAWYDVAAQNSRDERLSQVAEAMKLRMYAIASREGKSVQARQIAQKFSQQYVKKHEETLP